MAKHVILESYTFTPATKTVVVLGKAIRSEQLLLITNTTTNNVIYNFSDPTSGSSSHTISIDAITGLETTTLVLDYDTTTMTSTDKLSVLVEEVYQEILPAEVMRDPVDKFRVSTPQSLIDTDFEYGTQPTKWDNLALLAGRPTTFFDATAPVPLITAMTAATKLVTVTCTNTTGIAIGTPIFVVGTLDTGNADGWWIVNTVSANANFTFFTTNNTAATLFDPTKTYVYIGQHYTGSAIPTTSMSFVGAVITVTTTAAHGLAVGNTVFVKGTTATTNPPNGTWVITSIPTTNTFTFTANTIPTGAIALSAGANLTLYPRNSGFVEHRAFDGGVQFSNEVPYHGMQNIRQTRRYFRYQSGKGIQFSTGTILKPSISLETLTSVSTTVTATSRFVHGLLPGVVIKVSGAAETAYNGTFTVLTAPTPTTFTYLALTVPTATTATGFPIQAYADSWYGGSNRVGMFDDQNGIFFEFNGQTLTAVRRSSTTQISGKVSVTLGSSSVTGVTTRFADQLKPNDSIVIRGMSYKILSITAQNQLFISPEYRGTTATNCTVTKTIDTIYPQSSWNIDKCNGTGASSFNIDLSKMQMFYLDYTWYGAGGIRFGFKNNRGEVIYCHRIVNNNVNTEAYMRSGNLPARYEINTLPVTTNLTATLANTALPGAVINVADTSKFSSSGIAILKQAGSVGSAIEFISYSSKTSNTLIIASRAELGGSTTAQTFTYNVDAPILVELYSPQFASTISHWGSSVIMDGRFDDDKSFVFQGGMTTALSNITAGSRVALMTLRLSPSVDSGLTGLIGAREILNRMQLTLRSMGVYTTGNPFRIELILNGKVSAGTFQPVGGSSLAQIAYHTGSTTVTGGETIFSFFTNLSGVSTQDLSLVRDIGNSIQGGGNVLTVPNTDINKYPDGPDIITITATNIGASAVNTINGRISWTEAQA